MALLPRVLDAFAADRGRDAALDLVWELTVAARAARTEPGATAEDTATRLAGFLELQHRVAGAARRAPGPAVPVDADFLETLRETAQRHGIEGGLRAALVATADRAERDRP